MRAELKLPEVTSYGVIATESVQSSLIMRHPQVVLHLAYIPIQTSNINEQLLKTIGLIEEFKLEQDIIVKDDSGDYSSAVYENKAGKTMIVPPATHLKGGKQNRGNNAVEVLGEDEIQTVSVNCFEPGRGSGGNHFTEFEDVPADVAHRTMTQTDGYEGSWPIIEDYTKLIGVSDTALSEFNKRTEEDRAKYALNFETCENQTGVAIITRDFSMIEIFPTPNTFNIYKPRILRGKVASIFYKIHKNQPSVMILPSEIETKVREMIDYIQKGIELTLEQGIKKEGLIVGRHREGKKAMDMVLTDAPEPQIAYVFGAW